MVFFYFFKKKLYSYSKPERKMSCIFGGIADSKSRVPLFHLHYSWSPDDRRRRGNRGAELVIQYSHLPLEEEQGCPRHTRLSPDPWPATLQRSLIMTRWQMRELRRKKEKQKRFKSPSSPTKTAAASSFRSTFFFFAQIQYVNTHTWLQHISERNIIRKIIDKKKKMKAFKIVTSGVACHHLLIYH